MSGSNLKRPTDPPLDFVVNRLEWKRQFFDEPNLLVTHVKGQQTTIELQAESRNVFSNRSAFL
jgi:hypothetical protein